MTFRIKLRRDTAAAWTSANPILAAGEPGLETDTGKIKYGDGATAWQSLDYSGGNAVNRSGEVTVTAGNTEYWIAQQHTEEFSMEGRGLRYDSQGNLYSVTSSYNGDTDYALLTKYSPNGAAVWQRSVLQAYANSLCVDSSDAAYLAYERNGRTAIIKFDAAGTVIWQKDYDIDADWSDPFIEEKGANRIVMAANRDVGPGDVAVIEINSINGEVTRNVRLSQSSGQNIQIAGIDVDGANNVFVSGRYYDSNNDRNRMVVVKLDTDLNLVWKKTILTDDSLQDFDVNQGGDCASDAQGNVYALSIMWVPVVNVDTNSGTSTAVVLTKLNSAGEIQWTRRVGPGPCGGTVAGLTVSESGEIYLSTTTYEYQKRTDGNDYIAFFQGQNRLIVAKYDTNGLVLWQRYLDVKHVAENVSDFRGQALAVYGNKLATDFSGDSWGISEEWGQGGTNDNEAEYYLAQLPADGTEIAIGKMSYTPSRVPGRFVTMTTNDAPVDHEVWSQGYAIANNTDKTISNEPAVGNSTARTEAYNYVFGADGTLTVPNDGDVKLTQSQVGFLVNFGGSVNYDNNYNLTAITTDTDGNVYAAGNSDGRPFVIKVDAQGYKQWSVTINDDENGDSGYANGITIDPNSNLLSVTCLMYGSPYYSLLVNVDPSTGRIVGNQSQRFYKDDNDVELKENAFGADPTYSYVGGEVNGEFRDYPNLSAQTGSAAQKFIVLQSDLPGATTVNDDWQISGTGFGSWEWVSAVNQYSNLTSTTVSGSGSGFTFGYYNASINNQYLGYDNNNGFSVSNYGQNYQVGDQIKITGDQLGGTSPENDMVLTCTSSASGGFDQWSWAGTYQNTTWQILTSSNIDFAEPGTWQLSQPQSKQAILIAPSWTRLFGLPGDNYDYLEGVAVDSENNVIVVSTGYGKTYAQGGIFELAMVYKFNSAGALQWSRKLNNVDYSCFGKSITTVGTDIYVTHRDDDNGWTIITKLSADGTVEWQRYTDCDDDSAICAAGDGDVIVIGQEYNNDIGDDAIKVFKMSPTGEVVWKRWLSGATSNDTRLNEGRSITARDGYFYISGYFDTDDYDSGFIAKLPIDGSATGDYGHFRYIETESMDNNWWSVSYPSNINYAVYKINLENDSYAGAPLETPYVNTAGGIETNTRDLYVNNYEIPSDLEIVRDQDGGRIVFADGTTQSTSAQDVPQRRYSGAKYYLSVNDRGHHIYCDRERDQDIIIPYYTREQFPIGSVITFVNDTGSTLYVSQEGTSISIVLAGSGNTYGAFQIPHTGVATLLNVGQDRWFFSGNVSQD